MSRLQLNRNRKKRTILRLSLIGVILFCIGVIYAYVNKPTNIKYGFIDIQCTSSAISTAQNIANGITNTKPGIKVQVSNNENNEDLFYKMLNSEIDIIIPSRQMNDSERELAKQNNISFKELPFALTNNNSSIYIYIYINDMNYNHKPENKVFAKNYFNDWNNLIDTNNLSPLTNEQYIEVSNYLRIIDEF